MRICSYLAYTVLLGSLAVSCSCAATTGRSFQMSAVEALDLGQARDQIDLARLGAQSFGETRMTPQGRCELVGRYYQYVTSFSVTGCAVVLEFRNDRLNGFHFISERREDRTTVDLAHAETLESETGRLTKDDVLSLLGKPHGKVLMPTIMPWYEELSLTPNVAEIWGYNNAPARQRFGKFAGFICANTIFVCFDQAGTICRVTVEQGDRYHGGPQCWRADTDPPTLPTF
ncbi:MAG: hypothetical protein KBE65_13135 [Phycisphaerae bacterium]|nr:hypothetical protein [Phycisphaerae bacterium]